MKKIYDFKIKHSNYNQLYSFLKKLSLFYIMGEKWKLYF